MQTMQNQVASWNKTHAHTHTVHQSILSSLSMRHWEPSGPQHPAAPAAAASALIIALIGSGFNEGNPFLSSHLNSVIPSRLNNS